MKARKQVRPTNLYETMMERKKLLEYVINETEANLKKAPEGMLYTIERNKGQSYQYYLRDSNKSDKPIYLQKSQAELIQSLAQKKYDSRVRRAAEIEYNAINTFMSRVEKDMIKDIFSAQSKGEQCMVTPIMYDDDTYIKIWQEGEYKGRPFMEDSPEFYTDRGERVRSKSEVLIANTLNKNGIPYKYEFPLTLKNGITIYPDFTVLKIKTRKTFLWEHLGMMDDMEYVRVAIRKLDSYRESDIYLGNDLLLTHETSKSPLTSTTIENTIRNYLM